MEESPVEFPREHDEIIRTGQNGYQWLIWFLSTGILAIAVLGVFRDIPDLLRQVADVDRGGTAEINWWVVLADLAFAGVAVYLFLRMALGYYRSAVATNENGIYLRSWRGHTICIRWHVIEGIRLRDAPLAAALDKSRSDVTAGELVFRSRNGELARVSMGKSDSRYRFRRLAVFAAKRAGLVHSRGSEFDESWGRPSAHVAASHRRG